MTHTTDPCAPSATVARSSSADRALIRAATQRRGSTGQAHVWLAANYWSTPAGQEALRRQRRHELGSSLAFCVALPVAFYAFVWALGVFA